MPFPALLGFAVCAFRSLHLSGAGERYSSNTIVYILRSRKEGGTEIRGEDKNGFGWGLGLLSHVLYRLSLVCL